MSSFNAKMHQIRPLAGYEGIYF